MKKPGNRISWLRLAKLPWKAVLQVPHYFSPRILGLTGSTAQLEQMTRAYGAYFSYPDGSAGDGYLVEHSARLLVVDPDGDFDSFMPSDLAVDRVLGELRDLLE